MEWISFDQEKPPFFEQIIVKKTSDLGGYESGVYIARHCYSEWGTPYIALQEMNSPNKNNYRLYKEFSHWMRITEPSNIEDTKKHMLEKYGTLKITDINQGEGNEKA